MNHFIIIHNPNCSKSRATLELLKEQGISPQIIDYLNSGLKREFLIEVMNALGKAPKEVLRTNEEEFKALDIDLNNDEEVIEAILKHPKILERPIVKFGGRAVIARPPENVLELI